MRFTPGSLLLFFLLAQLGFNLMAQTTYEARGFSEKDGMCANGLNAICADNEGFVWMTSENGVSRFDGFSFYCFRHEENDPFSLLANKCDYVFKDNKGGIWIKSLYGLSFYEKQRHRFVNYKADPGLFSGISGGKIAEDSDGRLWLGGYGDVIIFDPATQKFKKSGWFEFAKKAGIVKQEKRNNAVLEVMRKNASELYILSVYGLFSVDTRTGTFVYHPNANIDDYWAFYLNYIDKEGKLWIGTYDQCFYIFNPTSGLWIHKKCDSENQSVITDILPLGRDSLLMLSDKKMLLYRPSLSSFSPIQFELTGEMSGVETGRFWKAYESGGQLFFLMFGNLPFMQMRKPSNGWIEKKLQLPAGFSNNVAQHTGIGNSIIIGDWNRRQVLIYDLLTNQYTYILNADKSTRVGVFQNFLKTGTQSGILVLSDRICKVDLSMRLAEPFTTAHFPNTLEPEFRNVVKDNNHQLYVRERNTGIWLINQTAKRIEPFFSPNTKGNFSDLFYEGLTQKFWLAQERNGVYVIESNKLTNKHYPLQMEEGGGASTINSIVGDGKGKVHLALLDHGLMVVNAGNMQMKKFSQAQGIPTDNVSFGVVDQHGNYWGTSQSGLYCLHNDKVSNYSYHRVGKQFFHRLSTDGYGLFFQNLFPSTLLGFDPKVILGERETGMLYLSEVKVNGKRIHEYEHLKLSAQQNSISVVAGCLLRNNWLKPKCEYSLNGRSWQPFDIRNELNFFNLAPDTYTLRIRRSDSTARTLEFGFVILPPWYMTKIFWFIIIVIILAAIYGVYNHRIRLIKKEEAVKSELSKAMSQMEMTALRAQMNPHFIFNCLNSINRFILTNEADLASEYLTRFSRLIRMVLDNSREEIISLEKELAALHLYLGLEAMRFHEKFSWKIEIRDGIDASRWQIPPMTLQPYVENAIWHGLLPGNDQKGLKFLNVIITMNGNEGIKISIDDNGIGRKAANDGKDQSRKSHGMKLTADRLSLISRTVGIKTEINIMDKLDPAGKGAGTTVNIMIYKNENTLT